EQKKKSKIGTDSDFWERQGNALKSQDRHEGSRTLPLKAMESCKSPYGALHFGLTLNLPSSRMIAMETRAMKQRILDAAQALIQQVGANAMSYQHISDAVGIRKASIHHHFPTKDQLIDALIQRYSAYFLGLVDAIIASEADAPSKVQRYMALFE